MKKNMLRWISAGLLSVGLVCVSPVRAAEEKKDEKEVKVKLEDVPAAVKATFLKEAEGNKLRDIEKETEKGKTIYETDVKFGKNNYEIKVAEDGTLISKKLDNEEDE